MKASVIVLNYNGKRFIKSCVDALLKQSFSDFEILFVDNASFDDSIEIVETLYKKQISSGFLRVIKNSENYGFAEGNNIGVRLAKGEYIVLLNNDTEVRKDWLLELLKAIETPMHGKPVLSAGAFGWDRGRRAFNESFYFKKRLTMTSNLCGEIVSRPQTDSEKKDGRFEIFYAGGLSVIFRKKDFPQPFDPSYVCYAEDVYLGWWSKLRGGAVVIAPKSRVKHYGGGSWYVGGRITKIAVFNGSKNQLMNYLIFYEWKNIIRIAPIFFVTQLVHMAQNPRKIPVKCKAYFWVLVSLRQIMKKRLAIQKTRRIADRELLRTMSCRLYDPVLLPTRWMGAFAKIMNVLFFVYCFLVGIRTIEFQRKR